ncbi:MAG: hypothetical protein FJ316_12760 [SAR202 cluster bacterium]|nr:hypothetical protein [SAR202 cluster bacterium]
MTKHASSLDFAPLVKQLIEKSEEGKLKWQPTANRKAFIVSVSASVSFMVSVQDPVATTVGGGLSPVNGEAVTLTLFDANGQPVWDIHQRNVQRVSLRDLYDSARRIGNNVDERLVGALSALERL